MSEEKKCPGGEEGPASGPTKPAYASPLKRIWAWVGVVYMVLLVLLVTYAMTTGGYLTGIGGAMAVPALGGAAASSVWLWLARRDRRTAAHAVALFLLLAGCAAMIAVGIADSIPAFRAAFGG